MSNPVLVEVTRGDHVESVHHGSFIVVDGDGRTVRQAGDVDRQVFPRSAVKAIQALPLIETGAADAFGLTDAELALACASHGGEPAHTELAERMLARAGLDHAALECGWHWPSYQAATIALARSGKSPTALHNNCSGKHSGFLCVCCHAGIDHSGYVGYGHRIQQMIRETMSEVTNARHDERNSAVDGCVIPTYAVPLRNLATGFAKMVTGNGLAPRRAAAARRLMAACMANPFYVAGTGRACTQLMEAAPGRIFAKVGAEGVFCAALPATGHAIALKCDDGAPRAADAAIAALLASLFADDEDVAARLRALSISPVENRLGAKVGEIRPAGALLS